MPSSARELRFYSIRFTSQSWLIGKWSSLYHLVHFYTFEKNYNRKLHQEPRSFSEKSSAVLGIPRLGVQRRKARGHESRGRRWLEE